MTALQRWLDVTSVLDDVLNELLPVRWSYPMKHSWTFTVDRVSLALCLSDQWETGHCRWVVGKELRWTARPGVLGYAEVPFLPFALVLARRGSL